MEIEVENKKKHINYYENDSVIDVYLEETILEIINTTIKTISKESTLSKELKDKLINDISIAQGKIKSPVFKTPLGALINYTQEWE